MTGLKEEVEEAEEEAMRASEGDKSTIGPATDSNDQHLNFYFFLFDVFVSAVFKGCHKTARDPEVE